MDGRSCGVLLQDNGFGTRQSSGEIGFTKAINVGRYKTRQPNVQTLWVLMHSSLAVTLTGTTLVLAAVKFWTRK
jgi:hypothetical protein